MKLRGILDLAGRDPECRTIPSPTKRNNVEGDENPILIPTQKATPLKDQVDRSARGLVDDDAGDSPKSVTGTIPINYFGANEISRREEEELFCCRVNALIF
jgi:hypothetical protein